jgi:hypothetical protein
MLPDYADITSRIPEDPAWYDGNGVPRYGDFAPDMLGVYDDCAILVQIACQSCDRKFLVGEGYSQMGRLQGDLRMAALNGTPAEEIKPEGPEDFMRSLAEGFHYGDPPRHNCVGDTMNCVDHAVIQAWVKNKDWRDWDHLYVRFPEVEGPMDLPDWARDV